jgi:predicted AlkP superfamily pyrophosphatase or phosphodiesterase
VAPPRKPKLVVGILVDQFRYDYLHRFRDSYTSGLSRLLSQGAVFTDANYIHATTVTAIGHSTFLSGATPSLSGIIGNEWFDRKIRKAVTSVSDDSEKLVGATGEAASPRRLLVSTIGDELKMAGRGTPKAIGISMKDRSAILPVGHMADGAFWFDNKSGNFVSSTYYYKDGRLPGWAEEFNSSRAADRFMGAAWTPIDEPKGKAYVTMARDAGEKYWREMQRTPFGNELVEAFAEKAVTAEKLGQGQGTLPDLLAISFSSNDYVGHEAGPDSPRVRDISIRTDRLLGKLFQFLEAKVGMANVLVVLTADHGVAPVPEENVKRKMPGGRLDGIGLITLLEGELARAYGAGPWFDMKGLPAIYLNRGTIAARGLEAARIRLEVASMLRRHEHVQRVYTWDQLAAGTVAGDVIDMKVRNGFFGPRAADLFVVIDPYWLGEKGTGTTHGTAYSYDTHVPVIFMGPWVKAGRYHRKAAPNDIAPTLAAMLEIETPAGSVGRVLDEMLR